jgi:hypothetical protein
MIIAAAIKKDDKIYTDKRHYLIIWNNAKISFKNEIQGFVNDKGEFLDREQAAKEALECGQIKELKYNSKELFSEDLW